MSICEQGQNIGIEYQSITIDYKYACGWEVDVVYQHAVFRDYWSLYNSCKCRYKEQINCGFESSFSTNYCENMVQAGQESLSTMQPQDANW